MRLEITTFTDVKNLVENLEDIDKQELAATGVDFTILPVEILRSMTVRSLWADDGTFCGIGGVLNNRIWLWTTTGLRGHEREFLRYSRRALPYLLRTFGTLYNHVWRFNAKHIKWLKWLGAEVVPYEGDFLIFFFSKKGAK